MFSTREFPPPAAPQTHVRVWYLASRDVANRASLRLPDNCTFEQAALAEPLSVLLHASRRADLSPERPASVLVFGVGAIGLLACALAKSYGAHKVVAIDINQARLDFAKENGFAQQVQCLPVADKAKTTEDQLRRAKDTVAVALSKFDQPDGFDIVFECTGAEPCIQMSIHVSFTALMLVASETDPTYRPQSLAGKSCSSGWARGT